MKYDLFSFIFIIKCQVDHKLGENKAENETHAEVLRSECPFYKVTEL